jgi:flagellar hook-associated protein 2
MAGSVIDVQSLVTQLVAAERMNPDAQITRRETKATVQISALANLKGGLAAFQKVLEPLRSEAAFSPKKATSGDEDVFSASASATAAAGTYEVEVVALAKAQQLASDAFSAGDTAVVGTGTLTITQGGTPFSVVIDSSNNTLAGIRTAINSATGNTGVQATIVREADGSHLVLTSTKTGQANTITVSQTGDAGLEQLTNVNLTELQPAQDAHIKLATMFDYYGSTNSIDEAIDGVTLDLASTTAVGETVTLNVTRDSNTLMSRVDAFVKGFNTLATQMGQLRSYTPATRQAGPLLGDAMLRGIEERLRVGMGSTVDGAGEVYDSLAAIGITKLANGQLQLDSTKFQKALNADSNAVAAIFGSDSGIAKKLYDDIDTMLKTDAPLETRNQALQQQVKQIQTDKAKLDDRMLAVQQRYLKQFTALDGLLSSMQTTSDYLTKQLALLPKPGGT